MAPPGELGGVTRPGPLGPGMGPTGGSFEFTAQMGSLTIAGFAGTTALEAQFEAAMGGLALAGFQASHDILDFEYEATMGALALGGFMAEREIDVPLSAQMGSVTAAGFAGTVIFGTGLTLEVSMGALSAQGFSADYVGVTGLDLTHAPGAVTLAGFAGTWDRYFLFSNQPGAVTLSGFSATYVGSENFNVQSRIGTLRFKPLSATLGIAGYRPPALIISSGVRHRVIRQSKYPRRVKIFGKWHVAQSLEEERKLLHEELLEQQRRLEEEELEAQIKTVTKRRIRYTTGKIKSLDAEKIRRLRELDRQLIALLAA